MDLVGAAHGGVPTPHVQEFSRHETPDGRVFPQQSEIATPAALQLLRRSIRDDARGRKSRERRWASWISVSSPRRMAG
ncbi:polymorphic toxin type 24 domain-containing protein [Microbispora maris]|uniref:polymorphic toxin type 24 domain-containing protein n=1 Tax=Microbispora maris TaxID=3144104 RepID=UPI003D15C87E